MKGVYKEAVKYIKNHNINIEDCISDNLHLCCDEFNLKKNLTLEDKNLFLRLIFMNIKINQCNSKVLKYLLKSDSKDNDVLFVLFNLIKKLTLKDIESDEELLIIQKCKNYWCYKFLRGVIVKIFAEVSNSKHYFEVLPLDFIIRYSLWTKKIFLNNEYSDFNVDLNNTIANNYCLNIEHKTMYNVSLIVKFLKNLNFMNYKYLRKTLMILDLEMYIYLPTKYTELGLINLISIINEYRSTENKKDILKDYLKQLLHFDIPFLRPSNEICWSYNFSLTIRKAFLQSIQSPNMLFEFIKCNQTNNDLDMIEMITGKVKTYYKAFTYDLKTLFTILIKSSIVSIDPYRRLLGLKLLMVTNKINNISQEILIRAAFDKSQIVRNFSKSFIDQIHFTGENIEKIFLEKKYKNLDILFDYIKNKSIDIKNLLKISTLKVKEFADGYNSDLCHNLLRFFIIFNCDNSNELIGQINDKLIKKYPLTSNENRIIRELCYHYYLNRDIDNLIQILLRIDDLGVILIINKFLKDLKVHLSENKIKDLIDSSKYNDNWIRKSAGLGILFKSISSENKKNSLNLVMKNIKTHIECNNTSCKSTNECENILYHNYSILLSIIDEFTLTIELLDLCFKGIGSTSWIVKNNSFRIYKYIYDKVESIEINEKFRKYIFDKLKCEFNLQTSQSKGMFNNTIFCLILLIKHYENINTDERKILTTIELSNRLILPNINNDESKNSKYIFEMKRVNFNENITLTSFLRKQQYSVLKKWLLVFISEDQDQKLQLFENVFEVFCFTHEKIIYEIVKMIFEKNKINTFLEEINFDSSFYDFSYIHFISNEILNK